ncbi:MAG: DUF2905 domain-containing protein [Bacteroidota bacterium]|nr:DUF2905 domain-containing protein [Bacteroidota bacterium]
MQEISKYVIGFGIAISLIGIILYAFHDKIPQIGKLPGDFYFENGGAKIFIPLTSMLIISIIINLIIWTIKFLTEYFSSK